MDGTTATTLTRFPPSPSSSLLSLTSDEAHEIEDRPKRILGVRELVKRSKSNVVKPETRREILIHGLKIEDEEDEPVTPGSPGLPFGRVEGGCFAKDVAIRGWRVVGGRKGGEKAQVGAYVVYDIEIELQSGGKMSILRRYTDFVNLRQQLKEAYPSLRKTIPQLPGKAHMSKFSPKFLAERQPRLQRFLRTVMLHPQMGSGGPDSVICRWITAKDLG